MLLFFPFLSKLYLQQQKLTGMLKPPFLEEYE